MGLPMKSYAPPRRAEMVLPDLNVTRDHDHDRFGMFALDVAQHVEAGAIGKVDVE